MKRTIDIKSLIIGILVTVLAFTAIAARRKGNTITAKEIRILNQKGKVVATLKGAPENGLLIYDREGKVMAFLGRTDKSTGFQIVDRKEVPKVVFGCADNGNAAIHIYGGTETPTVALRSAGVAGRGWISLSSRGKRMVYLGAEDRGGALSIWNKNGKRTATLQTDKDGYAILNLCNKDGEVGCVMTGETPEDEIRKLLSNPR